jgi:hypothetical protein
MANEFVAKNGLISQNNTTVSGSLTVTQGITGSFTGSLIGSLQGTSSYASQSLSSSFASNANQLNGQASSYYLNATNINAGTLSNTYLPSAINITSVTASFSGSLTGALIGTSSWAISASQAVTASYITGSIYSNTNPALSASFAITASFALTSAGGGTGGISQGKVVAIATGYSNLF